MLSTEDFISRYQKYTDNDLLEIETSIDNYSEEAKKAFNIVVNQRGGKEKLLRLKNEKIALSNEIIRVNKTIIKLYTPETDASFFKKMITSDVLSREQLDEVIENTYLEIKTNREEIEIKSKTIGQSIIGTIVASLIGGLVWGLQLIYSPRIFLILLAGIALICYGIIKLFTKKSHKNTAVLIASIIAVCLALVVGQILYRIIGYQE